MTAVAAELDVREPDRTRVTLALRVRVESGVLSSFELDGLDPDAAELEVATAPELVAPDVQSEAPGHLRLRWADRASAPRPGEHELRIAYITRQLPGQVRSGSSWAAPRSARKGSPLRASRSRTVRIVHRSGRSIGSSSSSQAIGTDTGAPSAGRGEYGATRVLLIAFCV